MQFSTTKINTFLWCKRQYQYRYIDNLPSLPTPIMERGLYVHALLSAYIKGEVPPFRPKDAWVYLTGQAIFREALKIFRPQASALSETRIARPFREDIILGIIDYFDNDTLIDFKVLEKMKTHRSPLQLSVYRYLIGRRRKYRYLHASEDGAIWLDYADKDLDFYEKQWQKTIMEIKDYTMERELSGKDFPDKKTKYCKKYCSYYPICFEGMSEEEYKNKIKEVL